jgi:hypothetical protein
MWATTFSLLNEWGGSCAQVSRPGIQTKTGAPEGALRTATIKRRQRSLIDEAHAHCSDNPGLLNPITEFSATEQP